MQCENATGSSPVDADDASEALLCVAAVVVEPSCATLLPGEPLPHPAASNESTLAAMSARATRKYDHPRVR